MVRPTETTARAGDLRRRETAARGRRRGVPAGGTGVGSGPGATLRALDERYSGLTLLLVAVDLVAGAATSILVLRLPFWWVVAVTTFMVASRTTARLYRRRLRLSYFDDLPKTLAATCSAFGVVIAAIMLLGQNSETSLVLLYAVLLFLLVSEPLRALVFQVARTARRRLGRGDRTLVVGTDPVAVNLVRNMLEHPEFGLRPVGFVDPQPQVDPDQLPAPLLRAGLAATITEHRVGTVVLGHTASGESQTVEEAIIAHQLGCMTLIVPRLDELYQDGPDVERLRSYPLIRLPVDPTRRPAWYVKRAADVGLAAAGLAAMLPVMAVCAAAILIESGRPVLFGQERIGLHGRPFRIYKLCTLTPVDERESATRWNVANDPRITATGRFLRRTSLDELPQLWNVLRGEMSLVGPRPERPGFVQRFSADHERYWARHRVPPGLTGLAQVNGLRGDTSIADRARYDNYYIANWSLWLDLKIILLTGREILRGGNR